MNQEPEHRATESEEVEALFEGLTTLGNRVESMFADCVVALMEQDEELADTLREDNYRTRETWLEVDKMCTGVMSARRLSDHEARSVSAAIKIAMDMKRMADESFAILHRMPDLSGGTELESEVRECIPRMAELTQDMLNDSVEALVNHSPNEAGALKVLYRELDSLNARLFEDLTRELARGEVRAKGSVNLILVARSLERVGDYALDISNHVRHLFRQNRTELPPDES